MVNENRESVSNISGMFPNVINILRDNIKDRYDSGFPVLKELIQNANDAKAKVLKIGKSNGIENANHPLLKKTALLVFNDGKVTDKDIEGIRAIAQGGKTGRSGVIGKFGLGMKSIFHFCDMFFYVAFQNGEIKTQAINPYIDFEKHFDTYHQDWNDFSENDMEILKSEAENFIIKDKTISNGLLLWLPLRDGSYKHTILRDNYSINDIWKLNDEELKKNIALSLAGLEISTPCNDGKRFLEVVEISTQTQKISLEYKIGSSKILSGERECCSVLKSMPITDNDGEKHLEKLIEKDNFSKVSYIDENDEEQELVQYSKNQRIGLAILKFHDNKKNSITFNWCSYLPLNGEDDKEFINSSLSAEYHILLHANFAIDSGRRNIVNFKDCIDRNKEINVENAIDDKTSQIEWNKILVRLYILPNVFKFIVEKTSPDFFTAFYDVLSSDENKLSYFCFDKGIVYKEANDWIYERTNSIKDSGLLLLNKTSAYYSILKSFEDLQYYGLAIKVCKYIQDAAPMEWAVISAGKDIENADVVEINKIVAKSNIPILFAPEKINVPQDLYKIAKKEIVFEFLLNFKNILENKACEIFEAICDANALDEETVKEILNNPNIKESVKLFKLCYFDIENTKHLFVGKTYKEVCEISANKRLFLHNVMSKEGKDSIRKSNLYIYQKICPKLELFSVGKKLARNQLFLKESNQYKNDEIELLNSDQLPAILDSMQKNIKELEFENKNAISTIIAKTKELDDEEIKSHSKVLRSLLVGRILDDAESIYLLDTIMSDKYKAEYFYSLINKYGKTDYNDRLVEPEFDIPKSLLNSLKIGKITSEELEQRLKCLQDKTFTNEERDKLATLLTNEDVFKSLRIHKTIKNEYISLSDSKYNVYLESDDENIKFPNDYNLPDNIKIIKQNERIPLQQKCLKQKQLKYSDIINIILCDEDNLLGKKEGINLSGYVCNLLGKFKIDSDEIKPEARARKWIPNLSYNFYALDEVFDCSDVNEKLMNFCKDVVCVDDIADNYKTCRDYFVKDKETAVKILLEHNDTDSDAKWPWFNVNDFSFAKSECINEKFVKYVELSGDNSIKIIKSVLKMDDAKSFFDWLKNNIRTDKYIDDNAYVSKKYAVFLETLCCGFKENTKADEDDLIFVKEILEKISESDTSEILKRQQCEQSEFKLPCRSCLWTSISNLVNFDGDVPDLKPENALHKKLTNFFPKIGKRITFCKPQKLDVKDFIEHISKCKNKKLWGAFCYCICPKEEMLILLSHGELLEVNIKDKLEKSNLGEISKTNIVLHKGDGNFCESLTGKKMNLSSEVEFKDVFFNPPELCNNILTIELFENFSEFTEISIEESIKKLFEIRGENPPSEGFFNSLANPSQTPIKMATNIIFANIFATLKVLKLDIKKAGSYRVIADEWDKYLEASGNNDYDKMRKCNDSVRKHIEANENTQSDIRSQVIKYIQTAEYQERCILFELFQNADDAYLQKQRDNCYFTVNASSDELKIEHTGRPINEHKTGDPKEYEYDLSNMLSIGWSDKENLNIGNQTGKFGYGFKTVYLICDEPHIQSGDYDFDVKAALYPEQAEKKIDYTDKTIITLRLNENGKMKQDDIVSDFRNAAQFLVMFSKKIKEIKVDGESYIWNPYKTHSLSKFEVQQNENFLLFRTIPKNIDCDNYRYASFAFKVNSDLVCELDDKIPKLWCLAPLKDFKGLKFAMNANFKTNTGRQTLAIENCENKEVIDNLAKMLVDAIFELDSIPELKCYIPSLINVLLDADTKTNHRFKEFSENAMKESLARHKIPNGTKDLLDFSNQEIFFVSARYFNDSVQKQAAFIDYTNKFLRNCKEDASYIVVTQIASKLLSMSIQSSSISVINLLDILLDKYSNDIKKQKFILSYFKDSPLYDFVKKQNEKLAECKIKDISGEIKAIGDVVEVSEDYGDIKNILESLFTPTRETSKDYYSNTYSKKETEENPVGDSDFASRDYPTPTIEDIYEKWCDSVDNREWDSLVEDYYEKLLPKKLHSINADELQDLSDFNSMPESWCLLILLGMCQDINVWKYSDTARKKAIDRLYNAGLITKFCNNGNLQTLYNDYLDYAKGSADEIDLVYFERLLRIYKIRKNFGEFFSLIYNLPQRDLQDINQFLVPQTDEELSGFGIELLPNNRSLKLGISLVLRELLLCGFYNGRFSEEKIENLHQFTYAPTKCTRQIVFKNENSTTSEEIYEEIKEELSGKDRLDDFLRCHNLPFVILGRNK